MKTSRGLLSLTIVVTLMLAVVLGCSSEECIGTVNYQGKTFQGSGKNETDAKLFACNNYCSDADPEYDAMYRIWLESPKGKAAGSPSKREAMFKDKDLLDHVTNVCARKCAAEMKPEARCKSS